MGCQVGSVGCQVGSVGCQVRSRFRDGSGQCGGADASRCRSDALSMHQFERNRSRAMLNGTHHGVVPCCMCVRTESIQDIRSDEHERCIISPCILKIAK